MRWAPCGAYECGTLAVPLDAARPQGPTIDLALERAPATGRRIGSLLINPGGPGESTLRDFDSLVGLLSPDLRARFDVVGFDPRGIGRSTAVHCLTAPEAAAYVALDPAPTTPAGEATLAGGYRAVATDCAHRAAALLPYVGSRDAARDMDRIRAAVGDDKLTYLGFSYGTYLGAVYAEQFPGRVRALALDGAVDPTEAPLRVSAAQAVAFEGALRDFLTDCAARPTCAWRPAGDPLTAYRTLLAGVARRPVPAGGGRTLGPGEALLGVVAPLYDRDAGWPVLARGLAQLEAGDGRILLALADSYTQRAADGTYSNLTESSLAIQCVDRPWPRDPAVYERAADAAAAAAPDFGRALVLSGLPCASWPAPATGTLSPVHAPGTPPVLVVGSTGDPATPYRDAVALAKQFPRGALLIRVGEGHTGYAASACVARGVDAYLIDLRVPTGAGARCDP